MIGSWTESYQSLAETFVMNKFLVLGVVLGLLSMTLAHNVAHPPPKKTDGHWGTGGGDIVEGGTKGIGGGGIGEGGIKGIGGGGIGEGGIKGIGGGSIKDSGIGVGGIGSGGTKDGGIGGGGIGGGSVIESCPRPSPESLRCLQQWACKQILRLDLRCLLTLNGNNLLSNLITVPGLSGGTVGGTSGGILGGLLGK